MKNPKKITFEGFYGFKNAGDDAFVEVASWGARKYWRCRNNVFLGADLPLVKNAINQKQYSPRIKGFDRLNLVSHLTKSDYLISAGGSTFGELPSHSNKAVSKLFKSIKPNLKLGAIGVSVGPFKTVQNEKDVIKYLQSLEFLALRDTRSFDYACSLNLPYQPINAFDLAALLPLVYEENKIPNKNTSVKTVGLSICNYESYTGGDLSKEQKRNTYFRQLVEQIAQKTDVNFKLFIINGNAKTGDREVSKELMKNIDKNRIEIIPYLGNVEKTWEEIANCDLMISTRLHASIFACYAQVPFMLLEYHKKCSDFLNDVGQNNKYRLFDADVAIDEIFPTIEEILTGKYQAPLHLDETITLSQKNFTHTIPLL